MSCINIQLPIIDAEQSVEIEVKVNGKKKKYHYRVEIFSWEECTEEDERAHCLRRKLAEKDENWQLVHIGNATEKNVPLMFKELN